MSKIKVRPGLPWMTDKQIAKVKAYLKPNNIMLEWGAGGSTIYFSKFVKKLYTIEHIEEWAKQKFPTNVEVFHVRPNYWPKKDQGVKESDITSERYKKVKLEHPYANDHAIRRYWQFRDYVDQVEKLGISQFDRVLIDGRARSFCAFKVLSFIDPRSLVFVDNFHDRPTYQDILNVYEEVDSADSLIVLRKKNEENR
jgi:hypothetical protein